MPDPVPGTVETDRLPIEAAPLGVGPFGVGDLVDVCPGLIWREYEIDAVVPGQPRTFLARDRQRDRAVMIHLRLIDRATAARRSAWAKLCSLDQPHLMKCWEAVEEGTWRYEITAQPSSMTLRDWVACHQSGAEEIEAFVRQVAPVLGELHAKGIGHFNLNPASIFIEEKEGDPTFIVGGLESATIIDQPQLIPIDVDPFYAPPEAAGLAQHQPGVRLAAWDWWSLGRMVQEFLIGRHVLGLLLDRDVSQPTPELRARAEQLLLEREPPGVRAGAVEHMSTPPASLNLLRGLLTGSCDARWGLDAVQRWLKREQVREYYDLPRTARLWIWKDRALTVLDAADLFTHAAHWSEGEQMLLEPDRPDTLAYFLRETPAYRDDWERLGAVLKMTESGGWQQIPAATRRIITTALGWLALVNGTGARGSFRVYGQSIDSPGLAELLKHPGGTEGVALFNALLAPAVLEYLETLDSTAARVLKGLATKGGNAARVALERGWLQPDNAEEFARLFHLALERTVVLQDKHALVRSAYAASRDAELSRILGEKSPPAAELVLSAFTSAAPERFGYVTHREWRHERYLALKAEADRVVVALLWIRLYGLLRVARLWSVRWEVFVGLSLGAAALAGWLNRSLASGALVAVLLLIGRAWLVVRVRGVFARCGDPSHRWGWRDGLGRAQRAADAALAEMRAPVPALLEKLGTLRASMQQYGGLQAKTVMANPHWWDVAGVFGLAASVSIAVLVLGLLRVPEHVGPAPASPSAMAAAGDAAQRPVHVESEKLSATAAEVATNPEALLASGTYEVVDDGFGRRLRGPLRQWDHFAPATVRSIDVAARAAAHPQQAAYAVVTGNVLLRPYVRSSVVGLLALQVPTKHGFGVMIFNTRDRQLSSREIITVKAPLPLESGTWYQLDGRRVLFLRGPLPLDADISLAPW